MPASSKPSMSSNNMLILLVLGALLAVGAAVVVDGSLIQTIGRDQNVLKYKQNADKALQDSKNNAPGLIDSYNSLGSSARILSDALPTTEDFPSVLVTMENMGAQSGVRVKSVSPVTAGSTAADSNAQPEPTTQANGMPAPQSVRFVVTFDGSYTSLVNFLRNVELSARPMRVVNLQLSGTGASLSGQVDIQTFYQAKAVLPVKTETIK